MAANPYKCEVEFKDAAGNAHKIALSMDAAARLEAKYDENISEVLSRLSSARMVFVIEMMSALLVGEYTEEEAARIVGGLGMRRGLELLRLAVDLGMAEEFEEDVPPNGSRPPKAGRRIGPPSSPTASPPG